MIIPAPLEPCSTLLVLIDYQEGLFPAMHDKGNLLLKVLKLAEGAGILEIPVILTEQYPRGLGPTLPEIKALLPDTKPIEKTSFSCCDEEAFCTALEAAGRKQVLVAGIEAHICVYQTAFDLVRKGYEVQVVSDCVSSRDPENCRTALAKLIAAGILPTTMEMALFELLKTGRGDVFKRISTLVK